MSEYRVVSIGPLGYERFEGAFQDRALALAWRDYLREHSRRKEFIGVTHPDAEQWVEDTDE
jgi:hypothetical protein